MKISEFPYKTSFSSIIHPVVGAEKDKYLSMASLKEVAELIPTDLANNEKNSDLLPVAFNAFVANRANKKDDLADSATAVAMAKYFVNKPINVEHNRQNVIGTIVSYAFSEFGTDNPLTEDEALKTTKPFNVVLGGLLWRVVNDELMEKIEDSGDPSSENYMKVSASWEVGFTDYNIALNKQNTKNLEDCDIIKDKETIEAYASSMKAKGGSGIKDGTKIFRLISGTVIPMGIGLTESPAADVKGVATPATVEEEDEEKEEKTDASDSAQENKEKTNKTGNNTSRASENVVIHERKKTMKIKKLEDITQDNLEKIEASEITDFIQDQMKDANEEYVKEKTKVEKALEAEKKAHDELKASAEEAKKTLETVQKELDELKTAAANREKQDKFNARMSKLDETYKLSDEEKQVIASDIADLDDEAFAKYETKVAVFLKRAAEEKKEEKKEEKTEASSKKEEANASEESAEEKIDEAEKEGTKEKESTASTSDAEEGDYYKKYKSAFSIEEGWDTDIKV